VSPAARRGKPPAPLPVLEALECRLLLSAEGEIDPLASPPETAEVGGTVWYDADWNGVRGPGEVSLPGWSVYLDLNDNGVLDGTGSTDLPSTDVPQSITDMTTATSELVVSGLGGEVRDVNLTLRLTHTWTGDLDAFLTGPSGTEVVLFFEVGGSGDDFLDTTFDDEADLSINDGSAPFTGRFRPQEPLAGFDGQGADGTWTLSVHDGYGGDVGLLEAWTLTLDTGEPTAVTDADGAYAFGGLPAGTVHLRQVLPSGWTQTHPADDHTVVLADGQAASGLDFGNHAAPGSVAGGVWHDADRDGEPDPHEPPLAGVRVFLDHDGDGAWDADEPFALTAGDGTYTIENVPPTTHLVVAAFEPGWQQSFPAGPGGQAVTVGPGEAATGVDFGAHTGAAIGGAVWYDANGDGERGAGEPGLEGWTVYLDLDDSAARDPDEPFAVTGADGGYVLPVAPGDYVVRAEARAGWAQTAPAGDAGLAVTVGFGEVVGDADFGAFAATAVRGSKWNDLDRDGAWDAGEGGLAGWRIYLDLDNDGQWSADEPFDITAADGSYEIAGLVPGSYLVAEQPQAGWTQSYPSADAPGVPAARTAAQDALLAAVQTTASKRPAYAASIGPTELSAQGGAALEPNLSLSGSLIGMDDFRADPRFAGIDGRGFAVVIVDTGADLDHSFFGPDADGDGIADRIVYQWDFAEGDGYAGDGDGHGTNVASIAVSQDAAYTGMAPGADLIVLKVLDDTGSGTFADIEAALQWVVDNAAAYNIAAVNMSLGDGSNYGAPTSQFGLGDELAALAALDVVVVSASGNDYYTFDGMEGASYPAADPNSLSIGAVWDGNNGGPFSWSSGAVDYTTGADRIVSFSQRHETMSDAFAPGARITGAGRMGGLSTYSGTSQAAPHIAGVVTLAQQMADRWLGRRLTLAEVRDLLRQTGEAIVDGDDEDDNVTNTHLAFDRVNVPVLAEALLAMGRTDVHRVELALGETVGGVDFGNYESAEVRGTTWYDTDQDGARDEGEVGLEGWRVYADGNANGRWDPAEPFALTGADGTYVLSLAAPQTVTIRLELPDGWVRTHPPAGYPVTVAGGDVVAGLDFGTYAPTAVRGTTWLDDNRSGTRDAGEMGLEGWRVFADGNANGRWDDGEPFALTATGGTYELTALPPGTYRICQEVPAGWVRTFPADCHTVTVAGNEPVEGVDFGNWAQTEVRGLKWYDVDRDGVRDATEPGLPDWRVFADLDDDLRWDEGEPFAMTGPDGEYALTGLAPGTYVVREVLSRRWTQTFGTDGYVVTLDLGDVVTGKDFGNYIRPSRVEGVKWYDADRDGVHDADEPGLEGWRIYVDINANGRWDATDPFGVTGPNGSYYIDDVPTGEYEVAEELQPGWRQTFPGGGSVYASDFEADDGGWVPSATWGDLVGDWEWGVPTSGPGAAHSGQNVWATKLDAGYTNADGTSALTRTFDLTALSSVTLSWWQWVEVNYTWDTARLTVNGDVLYERSSSAATPDWEQQSVDLSAYAGLAAVEVRFELYATDVVERDGWYLDDVAIEAAGGSGDHVLYIPPGRTVGGVSFGNYAEMQVRGTTWYDADRDGTRDDGEPGLDGWTIYLDLDDDGVRGDAEPFAVTGADGRYALPVGTGTYTVRQEPRSGWTQTAPADGAAHMVTVAVGEMIDGVDFGTYAPTAVRGVKWNDVDQDGVRDAGEPGLAGWRIYLDLDLDGSWSDGEPFDITDETGAYEIDGIEPGAYLLAEEPQPHWTQSFPGTGQTSGSSSVPESQNALLSAVKVKLTTTASGRRTYPSGISSAHLSASGGLGAVQPASDASGPLIGMDQFRSDARFAGIDGRGYAVAVLDTGVDLDHPFFGPDADGDGVADRIVYSWDFADGDPDATDFEGHGSNVTSITASQDATYTGMAPGADIVHLKVFGDDGSGTFAMAEAALQWVVANAAAYNIVAVNLSLGDGENYATETALYGLDDELAALAAQNVIVASSAGNSFYEFGSAQGVGYPAADPSSLAVGAVWDADNGGPFSWTNGAIDYTTGADRVISFSQRHETLTEVFAPGGGILGAGTDGGTVEFYGTSQASPHVAGVAVLLQQMADQWLGRRLTLEEVRGLFREASATVHDGDDEEDNVLNTGLDLPRLDMVALGEALLAMGRQGVHHVTVALGQTLAGLDFGNFESADIRGVTWYDADRDGERDDGEPGREGWRVYADRNANGTWDDDEPFTRSDADGAYVLPVAAPGTYTVRVELPAGWTQSHPAGGHVVSAAVGGTVDGIDFGAFGIGSVRGATWYDADRDGERDAGESPLAGWRVFADRNANGAWDNGEPFALTADDGTYELAGLAPGPHEIRQQLQAGWEQTFPASGHAVDVPAGGAVEGVDFGNWAVARITGVAYYDADQDGQRDPGEVALPDGTVYLDLNDNGVLDGAPGAVVDSTDVPRAILDYEIAESSLTVAGRFGAVRDVNVTLDITHTYDGDLAAWLVGPSGTVVELFSFVGGGGENFTRTTLDDEAETSILFGWPPFAGSFRPIGALSSFDGEPIDGTWTLFVEDDAGIDEGTLNSWSLTLEYGEPSTHTDDGGQYVFTDVGPGTYTLGQVLPPGWTQTQPAEDRRVTVGPAQPTDGVDLGRWAPPGRVEGVTWHDLDRDGQHDADEPPLPGWTVYLDANANGARDDGEPFALTDEAGAYAIENVAPRSYVVATVGRENWEETFPGGGVADRLFVADPFLGEMVELSPTDGAEINRFPLPGGQDFALQGLAFDGKSLWFCSAPDFSEHMLYEVDPDTGTVLDADTFADVGLTDWVSSLAAYGGLVVAYDLFTAEVFFVDPVADTVVGSWTAPVSGLGGLAGAGGRGSLFLADMADISEGLIYELDVATGAERNAFAGPEGWDVQGLAFVDGALYVGGASGMGEKIARIDPDTGAQWDVFSTSLMEIAALGGDDASGIAPFEGGTRPHRVDVQPGQTVAGIDFGKAFVGETPAPGAPDLLAGSDTGARGDDDITRLDNRNAENALRFEVPGAIPGAAVTLYADGVPIGAAVAAGTTATIVTNGTYDLADGERVFTATQALDGAESSASPGLAVTIDTVGPRVVAFGVSSTSSRWNAGVVDSSVWTGEGREAATAPWSEIDRLVVDFDEPVTAGPEALTVAGIVSGVVPLSAGSGGAGDRLTWEADAALRSDRYTAMVRGGSAGVADVAGNPLDGGAASGAIPSGTGPVGGDWLFVLHVLYADVDGNGAVTYLDRDDLRAHFGTRTGEAQYDVLADIDGSGQIDVRDRRVMRDFFGGSLPTASLVARLSAPLSDAAVRRFDAYAARRAAGEWSRFNALVDVLAAVQARAASPVPNA